MTLLSGLFGYPRKRSVEVEKPATQYAWRAERFNVCHPVFFGLRGEAPLAGQVVNLSVNGAAIHVQEWNWNTSLDRWMARLDQGDELLLVGLLNVPISCWVVVSDGDILRVHFASDSALRQRLHETIGGIRNAMKTRGCSGSTEPAQISHTKRYAH